MCAIPVKPHRALFSAGGNGWRGSGFIFQHTRQTDQSFIFLELCTVQSNSLFPPRRLWAVSALQQVPLWKCRLLSRFVCCFSCRSCFELCGLTVRQVPAALLCHLDEKDIQYSKASWQAFRQKEGWCLDSFVGLCQGCLGFLCVMLYLRHLKRFSVLTSGASVIT